MKTSTVEVGELISSLSAAGVQRQIAGLPGVHHVDVNYVAGSATVHYDETTCRRASRFVVVDRTGIEPVASSMPWKRSTK